MIQKCCILFCDNEHGTGDTCFPDIDGMDSFEVKQALRQSVNARYLRKQAKQAGWGTINGGDYCPACMESGV